MTDITEEYVKKMQELTLETRDIDEERQQRLELAKKIVHSPDTRLISDYNHKRFSKNCSKYWNLFYKHNTNNFFKDRHWIMREFETEINRIVEGIGGTLLEVGCGVGNFFFPLISDIRHSRPDHDLPKKFYVYACDFSPKAIDLIKENSLHDESICRAFVCDISEPDSLSVTIPRESVDVVSMIFVLGSILPGKMISTLQNIHQIMKPGGRVIFRDYAIYDHAQVRFHMAEDCKKVEENLYLRQDGTYSYFFEKEFLSNTFSAAGFETLESEYVYRRVENKKLNLVMDRIFIQSKFYKK